MENGKEIETTPVAEQASESGSLTKENGNEIFTVITDDNYMQVVPKFCNGVICGILSTGSRLRAEIVSNYSNELIELLYILPRPYTIIQEFYHIDRSYRDTYYTYYSNQHFDVGRFSRRLSFVGMSLDAEKFFSQDDETQKEIADHFMGACVINPLHSGILGRTLINPTFVISKAALPAYIRLTSFILHIYGKKFSVMAFPYRMQDQETMRCAEVTLLNIVEFFANFSRDYRQIVPSDILNSEQKHHHERVLPSRGISYPVLTKVLSEFGFAPRLYDRLSINSYTLSRDTQADELKRLLHYYVESGIPVAINLLSISNNDAGHSMVCIGHGMAKPELIKRAKKKKWISWRHRDTCHPLINSADFYEDYVVVDDNNPIYQIRNFNQLSQYSDMRVESIAVPMYKRMFLDASDAASIVRSILHDEKLGIDNWAPGYLKDNEDIIIRLFLTSSYELKEFRINTLHNLSAQETYALVPMPRFVYVCELYREEEYNDLMTEFEEIDELFD